MSHDQKISSFTNQALFQDTDLITFVRNGTNFNGLFSTLKLSLGVSGKLNPVGSSLGVPTLQQPVAGVNNFRAIESGKGIIASVSAQNGINVSSNFTQSTGGEKVIEDLSAKQYKFRTMKAVSPLELNVVGDSLEFSFSTSPLAQTNTVIVSDITDFPAPVGGVITLDTDINYIIVQPITTANRFICGANNTITANNPFAPLFSYTGSDTFFTGVDVNFSISDIVINAPSATLFNFSSPTSGGNTFGLDRVTDISCDIFGTVDNLRTLNISTSTIINCNQGLTVLGNTNWRVFTVSKFSMTSTSASFVAIDFGTSLHSTLELINFIAEGPAGSIAISGATNSANVVPNGLAMVAAGDFFTDITPISGITLDDIRWEFSGNAGLPDSFSDALVSINSNVTPTVIASANTPVKATGVFVTETVSRFTHDGTGTITYIGERNLRVPVTISCTLLLPAGGTDDLTAYLAINGSIVANSGVTVAAGTGDSVNVVVVWQHEFQPSDFMELWVENNSDSSNITVTDAVLRSN